MSDPSVEGADSRARWWLGRAFLPGADRAHDADASWVRARTEGEAPGPNTMLTPIEDPFAGEPRRFTQLDARTEALPLRQCELAPPLRPRTVYGIGRNYAAHAAELGNEVPSAPLCFLKAATSLLAAGRAIELPNAEDRIDMEAELVVVIGRRARRLDPAPAEAWAHVFGLCLGNDVSNRAWQRADKQWTRAKGSDGFGPLGPFVRVTEGEPVALDEVRVRGYYDDALVQDAPCGDMIFGVPELLAHLSATMTLEPGDLVFTGTPAGVHRLARGGVCRVETEGLELGRLVNPVV